MTKRKAAQGTPDVVPVPETGLNPTRFRRGSDVVRDDVVPGLSAEGGCKPRNRDHVTGETGSAEPRCGTTLQNVKQTEAVGADEVPADAPPPTLTAANDQRAPTPSAPPASHVRGGSGEKKRGSYCTAVREARAVTANGAIPFGLDPFSNPRSIIASVQSCQLERGDDGYASDASGKPGPAGHFAVITKRGRVVRRATTKTRLFIQPDYAKGEVLKAIRHYVHTRYVALLRFDPRPEWQSLIGEASEWIGVLSNSPGKSSFEFDAPPGVVTSSNTFPHALYARRYEDVTEEMRRICSYPDGSARHFRKRSALADESSTRAFVRRWGLSLEAFDLSEPTQPTREPVTQPTSQPATEPQQ